VGKSLCVWFEIPVADMERARKFYSEVMGLEVTEGQGMGENTMAFFPMTEQWDNSGALTMGPQMNPGGDGCYVYLNGGDDLSGPLARVEPAGGKIIVPKTQISPESGYFALFEDTEGNSVGLWSPK
jgi:predicted enzyme related to lactoylglutathione lyase